MRAEIDDIPRSVVAGAGAGVRFARLEGPSAPIPRPPIGIATEEFMEQANQPATVEQLGQLRTQYQEQKVILAVDRLDYTKGIPERLRTFRRLLTSAPELIGNVILLQVAVPSRENVEDYRVLRREPIRELPSQQRPRHRVTTRQQRLQLVDVDTPRKPQRRRLPT